MQVSYEKESAALREAMKGMGTDEDAIIRVSGKVNSRERQEIRKAYKTAYGRDLIEDL